MSNSEDRPGTKGNPIPIDSIEQARANLSYVIRPKAKPVKKPEAPHGETV